MEILFADPHLREAILLDRAFSGDASTHHGAGAPDGAPP